MKDSLKKLFARAQSLRYCFAFRTPYPERVRSQCRQVDTVIRQGPYRNRWESLRNWKVPAWYRDAKFGIFIHWGLYSVPAFGSEWYPRLMYQKGSPEFEHHLRTYGPQSEFGYKDFIPRFTAQRFDASRWAELFVRAGARYVVPVAEHHDGYPLYDCSLTDWSTVRTGPRRDFVAELSAAVRSRGMHFGVSSHRAEHWFYFDEGRKIASDVSDARYEGLYGPAVPWKAWPGGVDIQPSRAFLNDWLARTAELVELYQPELVWFDWWIEQPAFEPYLRRFAAFYYNLAVQRSQEVVINYKNRAFPEGTAILDIERGKLDDLRAGYWQTDTSIGLKSWGYIEGEEYRTAGSLIADLADIVSKNGCLLLNLGPDAEGVIPKPVEETLIEIGDWLAANGEAIYGTRPWVRFGEGPTQVLPGSFTDARQPCFTARDVRYTACENRLYAILLGWPGLEAVLTSLCPRNLDGRRLKNVRLLGCADGLMWRQETGGIRFRLPETPPGRHAWVLRMELDGEAAPAML